MGKLTVGDGVGGLLWRVGGWGLESTIQSIPQFFEPFFRSFKKFLSRFSKSSRINLFHSPPTPNQSSRSIPQSFSILPINPSRSIRGRRSALFFSNRFQSFDPLNQSIRRKISLSFFESVVHFSFCLDQEKFQSVWRSFCLDQEKWRSDWIQRKRVA